MLNLMILMTLIGCVIFQSAGRFALCRMCHLMHDPHPIGVRTTSTDPRDVVRRWGHASLTHYHEIYP